MGLHVREWIHVHGAGAQRSDPKSGNPSQWPYGHGPQGDFAQLELRAVPSLSRASTVLAFNLPMDAHVVLEVFDLSGRHRQTLISGRLAAGEHRAVWTGADVCGKPAVSGLYLARLRCRTASVVTRLLVQR